MPPGYRTTTATTNTYSAGEKVLLYTNINIRESMSTTAKKVAVAYAGENMNDGVVFRIFTSKKMKKPAKKKNKKGIIET